MSRTYKDKSITKDKKMIRKKHKEKIKASKEYKQKTAKTIRIRRIFAHNIEKCFTLHTGTTAHTFLKYARGKKVDYLHRIQSGEYTDGESGRLIYQRTKFRRISKIEYEKNMVTHVKIKYFSGDKKTQKALVHPFAAVKTFSIK